MYALVKTAPLKYEKIELAENKETYVKRGKKTQNGWKLAFNIIIIDVSVLSIYNVLYVATGAHRASYRLPIY